MATPTPGLMPLLERVAAEIEADLKAQIAGLYGGIIRRYLPQVWNISTDREKAYVIVDAHGTTRAYKGLGAAPDVTIRGNYAVVCHTLHTRSRAGAPPGDVQVVTNTEKGETAFQFVRGRLGF